VSLIAGVTCKPEQKETDIIAERANPKTVTLSGTVFENQNDNSSVPLADVVVEATGDGITLYDVTDPDGYYEFTVPKGWTGELKPIGLLVRP